MQSAEDVIKERLQVEGQVKADVLALVWAGSKFYNCITIAYFLNHPMQVANAYTGSFDAFRQILQHDTWLS